MREFSVCISMKRACYSNVYQAYAPVLNAFAESHHIKYPSYLQNQDLLKALKVRLLGSVTLGGNFPLSANNSSELLAI